MHTAIAKLGLALSFALLTAGCINREGSFEGELTQKSTLEQDGKALAAGASKPVTLQVQPAGNHFTTSVEGCVLRLVATGTAELSVESGQTCELSFGGYTGSFDITGTGGVNRNSAILSLQLTAKPRAPALQGAVDLSFTGTRK